MEASFPVTLIALGIGGGFLSGPLGLGAAIFMSGSKDAVSGHVRQLRTKATALLFGVSSA